MMLFIFAIDFVLFIKQFFFSHCDTGTTFHSFLSIFKYFIPIPHRKQFDLSVKVDDISRSHANLLNYFALFDISVCIKVFRSHVWSDTFDWKCKNYFLYDNIILSFYLHELDLTKTVKEIALFERYLKTFTSLTTNSLNIKNTNFV